MASPTPEPESTIDVAIPSSDQADVTVQNVQANEPVTVELPALTEPDESPGDLSTDLESITITPTVDVNFSLDITASPDPPEDTPEIRATQPSHGLRYFTIQEDLTKNEISEATFRFRVQKSRVANLNQRPENVAMLRFNDGQWAVLPTQQVEETTTHYVFEATTPGFSVFAVGVQESAIALTDATLGKKKITVGKAASITATLENTGKGSHTATVNLTVNGTVIDTRQIEIPARETIDITFNQVFDKTGSFDVMVNGVPAGTLTVEEAVKSTTAPQPTTRSPTATPIQEGVTSPKPTSSEEPSSPTPTPKKGIVERIVDLPGFGIPVAIVALILAVLIAIRRRD